MSKNTAPLPGDVIFADRGIYNHYGIYIGRGQVIHFSGPKGHETTASLVDVIQTSIEEFHKGDEFYIERYPYDFKYKPFKATEVIRRAKSKLGKEKGNYDLVNYNCEHFANWCKYGVKFSSQVEQVARTIVKIAGPFLKFLYLLSYSPVKKEAFFVSTEDLIQVFKDKKHFTLLQSNHNLLPVFLKEQVDDGFYIYGCIFNKKTEELAEEKVHVWHSSQLADNLQKAFAGQNMIILNMEFVHKKNFHL